MADIEEKDGRLGSADRATGLRPQPAAQSSLSSVPDAGLIVHNVTDRRNDWIGPWGIEPDPVDLAKLWAGDEGRTVIYRDYGRAEAGTLSSWNDSVVFVRFHKGDTAAACAPASLHFAIRDASPDFYHPLASATGARSGETNEDSARSEGRQSGDAGGSATPKAQSTKPIASGRR